MSPALAVALAGGLVLLAAIAAIAIRRRDGRRRGGGSAVFDPIDAGTQAWGTRATLVQFSTEMCARCPQVRRLLSSYAERDARVTHVEVDLTHRPDLSTRYRVLQTPTTFVVDATGAVRARFSGVPHRHALDAALADV